MRRSRRKRRRSCDPYLAEEQNSLSHSVRSLSQGFRYVFHLDHAAQARCHLGNRISQCSCLFSFKYFTSLWIISVSPTYFDFIPVIRRTSKLVKHKGNKLQFFTKITLSSCSYQLVFHFFSCMHLQTWKHS
jgi:hypothetical protein